jgi:hypothetical protein
MEDKVLDEKMKVEVENIGRGAAGYQCVSNPLIQRVWHKPGIKKFVTLEELREAVASPGGYLLFTRNLLIKDLDVRIELDLPTDKTKMVTETDLENLLKGNPAKLKEIMPQLYKETQKRIAEKAAEMKIDNLTKLEIIKEFSGVDVYKMMQAEKEKIT